MRRLTDFPKRTNLEIKGMRGVEEERLNAQRSEIIAEHIESVEEEVIRFNVRDPSRIINLDETGISFKSMTSRSIRRGIGIRKKHLFTTVARTKGNLERLTLMGVVSASGHAFKPLVDSFFAWKKAPLQVPRGWIHRDFEKLPTPMILVASWSFRRLILYLQ